MAAKDRTNKTDKNNNKIKKDKYITKIDNKKMLFSQPFHKTLSTVFILEGNSEIGAHVWGKIADLI